MRFFFSISLLFLFLSDELWAQSEIPVGEWRTHLTYFNARAVEEAENRIYAASETGFFYFDRDDNTINQLTKLDGLSDVGVADMIYHPTLERLLVLYRNGNIDVLETELITNVRTVLNLELPDKEFFTAFRAGNRVYLCGSIGIVVYDLAEFRIIESYRDLGISGDSTSIYGVTIFNDSLFAATETGLIAGSLNANLLDFNQWERLGFDGSRVSEVVSNGENLFFIATDSVNSVYQYGDGTFNRLAERPLIDPFTSVNIIEDELWMGSEGDLRDIDGEAVSVPSAEISIPKEIIRTSEGTYWVADEGRGLVRYQGGNSDLLFIDGPFAPSVQEIKFLEDRIVATAGQVSTRGQGEGSTKGFYTFQAGEWQNYTSEENFFGATAIPPLPDLNRVAYQFASDAYYFTSFGGGLLKWNIENDSFETITAPFPTDSDGIRLTGVDTDFDDRLWLTAYDYSSVPSIYILDAQNNWSSISLGNDARRLIDLTIDGFNQGWAIVRHFGSQGILVFNENSENRILSTGTGLGGLGSTRVNCIVEAKDGTIWIGTENGVSVYFDPFTVFTSPRDADAPINNGRDLLEGVNVFAIAVDGADRKWLGTSEGLFLFNSLGNEEILHFTAGNSPLLTNDVTSLAIHPTTGELFVGSPLGIVSYRTDATEASFLHQSVKIFPNPVPSEYNGLVGISGLTRNGNVKITDISGKKIREVTANGGTATWDISDYNGNRAKTGVYLVFSSSDDGEQTYVGKVAVIE